MFTDGARGVLVHANRTAERFGHEYVGTEHILLGLIEDAEGAAAQALSRLGVDLNSVREETEQALRQDVHPVLSRGLPQTPLAKTVIESAMKEARNLRHNFVGTEHLLLQTQDGFAAQVLSRAGVTLPAVLAILNDDATPEAESAPQAPRSVEAPPRVGAEFYRRFTPRARKVLQLSIQEAQRYNHEFIGTEHLLLALIMEGSGVAAEVRKSLELDLRDLRAAVEKWSPPGRDMVTNPKLPQTPRAKRVIVRAIAESDALGHEQVDTAHLLLALLREPECLAVQILSRLGHPAEAVRERTLQVLMAATPPRGEPPN